MYASTSTIRPARSSRTRRAPMTLRAAWGVGAAGRSRLSSRASGRLRASSASGGEHRGERFHDVLGKEPTEDGEERRDDVLAEDLGDEGVVDEPVQRPERG